MTALQMFLWVQCCVNPPSPLEINRAIDLARSGPSLPELQQAVLAQAMPKLRSSKRWIKRARASASMPSLSVQLERRENRGWDLNQSGGDFDQRSTDRGYIQGIRVRATWDFSYLVFNPDELRVVRAELDLIDWQKEQLIEVTRLYFERLRLVVSLHLAGSDSFNSTSVQAFESKLRILEIQGMLMALTGLDWETK